MSGVCFSKNLYLQLRMASEAHRASVKAILGHAGTKLIDSGFVQRAVEVNVNNSDPGPTAANRPTNHKPYVLQPKHHPRKETPPFLLSLIHI